MSHDWFSLVCMSYLVLSCLVMQCNAMHVRMITYVCLFVSHLIPATYPNKMATNPIVGSIYIYVNFCQTTNQQNLGWLFTSLKGSFP